MRVFDADVPPTDEEIAYFYGRYTRKMARDAESSWDTEKVLTLEEYTARVREPMKGWMEPNGWLFMQNSQGDLFMGGSVLNFGGEDPIMIKGNIHAEMDKFMKECGLYDLFGKVRERKKEVDTEN